MTEATVGRQCVWPRPADCRVSLFGVQHSTMMLKPRCPVAGDAGQASRRGAGADPEVQARAAALRVAEAGEDGQMAFQPQGPLLARRPMAQKNEEGESGRKPAETIAWPNGTGYALVW